MAKILLVEDDLDLSFILRAWFNRHNDILELCESAEDALHMLAAFNFDVILVDWELPGMNGFDMCRYYRLTGGITPIIFISARVDPGSRIASLDVGADDFVCKPFDLSELSARVRSVLRRHHNVMQPLLSFGDVQLDPRTRTVTAGDKSVKVPPKQCALLEFLLRRPHQCFSSSALLNSVWPSESDSSEESVRTCVKTLRRQLAEIGKADFVKSSPRSGYFIGDA